MTFDSTTAAVELVAVWPLLSGQRSARVTVKLHDGGPVFVKVTGVSKSTGMFDPSQNFTTDSQLLLVDGATAMAEIAACCTRREVDK